MAWDIQHGTPGTGLTNTIKENGYKDMDGILINKLRGWFRKAFAQLQIDGITQDIHVDELLIDDYKALSRAEILYRSYQVFDCLVQYITNVNMDISNFNLLLSIDLESEFNVLQWKPTSISEIEGLLDMFSVPEIILYYDANPNEIPLTELYRTPILLNSFAENDNIRMFYKEYRVLEDQISNNNYTRSIDIVYTPHCS